MTFTSSLENSAPSQALHLRLSGKIARLAWSWPLVCCLATLAWAQTSPPVIANGGVLNAADYGTAVAPGTMVSIFGTNLAPRTAAASSVPLPTALEGVTVEAVTGTGANALPLFFVSAGQINAQLPYSILGTTLDIRVRTAAGTSASQRITVATRAPRLFTRTMDGKGEGILLHGATYRLVTEAEPATPAEYLILYLTGLGEVSPAVQPGRPGGDGGALGPLNQVTIPVTATLGGQSAPVVFAGLAPGFVGVYQLNLQVPANLSPGKPVVVVSAATITSQTGVWVSVGVPLAQKPESVLERALTAQANGDVNAMMAELTTFDGSAAKIASNRKVFEMVQRTVQFSSFRFTHLATSLGDRGTMALVRAKVSYSATVKGQSWPLTYGLMAVLTKVANAWKVAAILPDELLNLEDAAGTAGLSVKSMTAAAIDLKTINQLINEAMSGGYVNQDKLEIAITFGFVGQFGPVGDAAADGYQAYDTLSNLKDSVVEFWSNGLSPIGFLKLEQVGAGILQIVTEPIPGVDAIADAEAAGLDQFVYNLEIQRALRQFKVQLLSTPLGGVPFNPQLALLDPFKFSYPAGMETAGDPTFVHAAGQPLRSIMFKSSVSVGHQMPFRVLGEMALELDTPLKIFMDRLGGTLRGSKYYVPVDVTHLVRAETVSGDILLDNFGRYRGPQSGSHVLLWDANCRRGRELLRVTLRNGETTPVVNVANWFMNVVSDFLIPELDTGKQFKMKASTERDFTVGGTSPLLEQRFWPALIPWPACFDMQVLDSSVAAMDRGAKSARLRALKKGTTELILLLPASAGDDAIKELRQSIPISVDGVSLPDWLQLTRGFFMTARISTCYLDSTGVERCDGGDFSISNARAGSWAGQPALSWAKTTFSAKGRTTVMWDRGGNYDLDLSGDMDADGATLKHARLLVKNYDSSGNIYEDWDVELFDYPLFAGSFDQTMATCTKCELYYAFLKPPDWSQKIKINKMSTYSTMNGQTREVRKFTRIQSVSSSWVYLGRP
jgi:uncharacterized protein (TIGR03437 family)